MKKRQQLTDAQKQRHTQKVEAWKARQPERDAAEKVRKEKLEAEEEELRKRMEQRLADGIAEDEANWARQAERDARIALLPEDEQEIVNGIYASDYWDEGEDLTTDPHAFLGRFGITDLDVKRAVYALWWIGVFAPPYGLKITSDDEILTPLLHTGFDTIYEHIMEAFSGVEKAVHGFHFTSTAEGFEFSYVQSSEAL